MLPTTERTIVRNTGVAALAPVLKYKVDFTYTDNAGVVKRRRGVTVLSLDTTGKAPGRALIRAVENDNFRSFRNDRVIRMVKSRKK